MEEFGYKSGLWWIKFRRRFEPKERCGADYPFGGWLSKPQCRRKLGHWGKHRDSWGHRW